MPKNRNSRASLPPMLSKLFDESIERFVLPNGLTVILKEIHTAKLASAQIWVKTGSIHEGAYLGSGLSHYLEHMLFKGTEKREGVSIAREVQSAGGYINAYTTFDRTVYYIDLPSETLSVALDILADVTFNSLLPEEEVEKERGVILREIAMGLDDPDRQVSHSLFRNAYRVHPYRHPVIGHREAFEAVTREELFGYYRERYVPNNCVLVVTGDIDSSEVKEEIEQIYGSFARKRLSVPYIPTEPIQMALREEHIKSDVNICRGGLGFKIPGLTHPDAPAMDILSAILGNGNSSILWRRLRDERQIVHYVDTSCWNPGTSGLFWVSYLCDTDKQEETVEAIHEELESITKTGIEEKRLAKALRQGMVSEINSRKTISGQASRQGICEVVIGDLNYPRNYFSRIQELDTESVTNLINKYLVDDHLTSISLNTNKEESIRSRKSSVRTLPDFEEVKLKNGVRVLFQSDNTLPKINIRTVHLGGGLYEAANERGVTNLVATLLTKDTKNRTANEVAETIESVGGGFSDFSGNNSFGLSLEVLSDDIDLGLEVLSDGLFQPVFTPNTFDIERNSIVAQLKEEADEIVNFGRNHLRKKFFGEHPFNMAAEGSEETLQELGIEELRKQYEKLITASNTVISIAGDFDPEKLLPKIETFCAGFPTTTFEPANSALEKPAFPGHHEMQMEREQAVVFQAYPDVGATAENFVVGEILDELYSEMSGNLFDNVREKRSLAYYVGASRIVGINHGMFFFYSGTQPTTYNDVFEEIEKEVVRTQEGKLTEEEIERCKTRLKVQKRSSLQTISSRAMQAALNRLYNLPPNDWNHYDERIDAVTIEDLQNFAQTYFKKENKVTLVVKPE